MLKQLITLALLRAARGVAVAVDGEGPIQLKREKTLVVYAYSQHSADAAANARYFLRFGVDAASPDAVFVGGGLSREGLLEGAWQALNSGGVLVANAVTLEGQAVLSTWRERVHGDFTTLSVSRGEAVGRFTGLRPLMPVLQWVGRKP